MLRTTKWRRIFSNLINLRGHSNKYFWVYKVHLNAPNNPWSHVCFFNGAWLAVVFALLCLSPRSHLRQFNAAHSCITMWWSHTFTLPAHTWLQVTVVVDDSDVCRCSVYVRLAALKSAEWFCMNLVSVRFSGGEMGNRGVKCSNSRLIAASAEMRFIALQYAVFVQSTSCLWVRVNGHQDILEKRAL